MALTAQAQAAKAARDKVTAAGGTAKERAAAAQAAAAPYRTPAPTTTQPVTVTPVVKPAPKVTAPVVTTPTPTAPKAPPTPTVAAPVKTPAPAPTVTTPAPTPPISTSTVTTSGDSAKALVDRALLEAGRNTGVENLFYWRQADPKVQAEAKKVLDDIFSSPDKLGAYVKEKNIQNVQGYSWWKDSPLKQQAWEVVQAAGAKNEGAAPVSSAPAPAVSQYMGANAEQLLDAIKAGQLRPDPNNLEWSQLNYGVRSQAYQMWSSYNRFSGLSADLLAKMIERGEITPDPGNPGWRALYVDGQPTPAQIEAYRIHDEKTNGSPVPGFDGNGQWDGNPDNLNAFINGDTTLSGTDEDGAPIRDSILDQIDATFDTSSIEQMRTDMEAQYDVEGLRKEAADWKLLLDNTEATRRKRVAGAQFGPDSAVEMDVISGRIGEIERQENERIDFYQRQYDYAQGEYKAVTESIEKAVEHAETVQKDNREALYKMLDFQLKEKQFNLDVGQAQFTMTNTIQQNARKAITDTVNAYGKEAWKLIPSDVFAKAGYSQTQITAMANTLTTQERLALEKDPTSAFGAYIKAVRTGDSKLLQAVQDYMTLEQNAGNIGRVNIYGNSVTDNPAWGGASVGGVVDNSTLSRELRENCVLYIRTLVPELPSGLRSLEDKKRILLTGPNASNVPIPGAVGVGTIGKDIGGGVNSGHVWLVKSVDTSKKTMTIREANYVTDKDRNSPTYGQPIVSERTISYVNNPEVAGFWIPPGLRNTQQGNPVFDKVFDEAYKQTNGNYDEIRSRIFSWANPKTGEEKMQIDRMIAEKKNAGTYKPGKAGSSIFSSAVPTWSPAFPDTNGTKASNRLSTTQIVKLKTLGVWRDEYKDKPVYELPDDVTIFLSE